MHISHSRWKTALIAICLLTLLAGCSIQKGIALPAGSARADRQHSDQSHPQLPDGSEAGDNGEKPDAALEDKPSGEPEPVPPRDAEPEETGEPTQTGGTEAENARAARTPETGVEKPQGTEGGGYDFSQPVPESPEVDNSYFADAAFIGDSRTDGFMIYSGIGNGKNLTSNGLSIFKLKEKKALTIDGKKYTLLEALALEQYGKVYLSLGVNELGYNNDKGFYEKYRDAIQTIRQLQPNAVIYIQGLIPLNEGVIAKTGGSRYLTNEHLRVYNDLMRKAAQEEGVVFLDLYSEFADGNNELPAEASKDGVHLRGAWCRQWLAYLKTHTVDYKTLYPSGSTVGLNVSGGAEDQGQSDLT